MLNYELPENLTLFGQQFCDVASGKYEPDIRSEEAGLVRYPCSSSNINLLSCKHPKFSEIAASLGGLSFIGRNVYTFINPNSIPPVIPEGTVGEHEWFGVEYVAFSLRDILPSYGSTYAGVRKAPRVFNFISNKRLLLGNNTKSILSLSGSDSLIEGMTSQLGIELAAKQIADLGFDYVIPPDYSAFLGECVASHRLNQIRSFVFAEQLIANGVHIIPHIFPSNAFNLDMYIKWLQVSDVSIVAVNAQMCKSGGDQYFLMKILTALLNSVPDLHIIVQGGDLSALKPLSILLQRVHITNRTAIHLALSSHRQTYNFASDSFVREYSNEQKHILAMANIQSYYDRWFRYISDSKVPVNETDLSTYSLFTYPLVTH